MFYPHTPQFPHRVFRKFLTYPSPTSPLPALSVLVRVHQRNKTDQINRQQSKRRLIGGLNLYHCESEEAAHLQVRVADPGSSSCVFSPSPKSETQGAWEDMPQLGETQFSLLQSLLEPGPRWTAWCLPTLGRASSGLTLLPKMLNSSRNRLTVTPENNSWPAMWASPSPVKLT